MWVGVYLCLSLSLLQPRMCKRYTVSRAGERWECLAAAVGQEEEMVKLQHGEEAGDCWCQVVLKVKAKSLYSTITNSEAQPEAIRSVLGTENVLLWLLFTDIEFSSYPVHIRLGLGCAYQQRAVQGNICDGHVRQQGVAGSWDVNGHLSFTDNPFLLFKRSHDMVRHSFCNAFTNSITICSDEMKWWDTHFLIRALKLSAAFIALHLWSSSLQAAACFAN